MNKKSRWGVFKKLNTNKKFILGTIFGMILSSFSVYVAATAISSKNVVYNNTNSNLKADNVQDAVDELYSHATDYTEIKNYFKNNPTSYFSENDLRLGQTATTGNTNLYLYNNGKAKGVFFYDVNSNTTRLASYDSNQNYGKGELKLEGNPVTINGSLPMMAISGFSTSDGRYYTKTLSFSSSFASLYRFPFIILKAHQGKALEPIYATYDNDTGNIYFSNTDATYNTSTKVLTIDNGSSAWAQPIIIAPSGYIN